MDNTHTMEKPEKKKTWLDIIIDNIVNFSNLFDITWLFFCGFSLQSLFFIINFLVGQLTVDTDYFRLVYCIVMAWITFPKNKIQNRYIFICCGFLFGILVGII
ncbi:MAG: hypothetical protein C6Y22_29820 [Hapalosiphonaceae cyanobacterium JJU2]|nr:MAG: hypothetical protein C6Y22_29820 [Hapalosiphonaceae cyanobacterium JJU2]